MTCRGDDVPATTALLSGRLSGFTCRSRRSRRWESAARWSSRFYWYWTKRRPPPSWRPWRQCGAGTGVAAGLAAVVVAELAAVVVVVAGFAAVVAAAVVVVVVVAGFAAVVAAAVVVDVVVVAGLAVVVAAVAVVVVVVVGVGGLAVDVAALVVVVVVVGLAVVVAGVVAVVVVVAAGLAAVVAAGLATGAATGISTEPGCTLLITAMVLGPGKLPGSVTGAESTSGATLVIFSWFNWFVVPPVFCTATIAVAMPELSVSVATSIGELAPSPVKAGKPATPGLGKGRKGRAVPPPKVHERAAGAGACCPRRCCRWAWK